MNDTTTTEEMYYLAANATDLKVDPEKRGSGDVLIAAGWAPARVGMCLLRLASEYDGGESSQRRGAGETDAKLLAGRLKSLSAVLEQVEGHATTWAMGEARSKAKSVVLWWLDSRCKRCTGRKYEQIPGSPALSAKVCKACGGTGLAPLPYGQDGRRLANYMDDCVIRARLQLKARLRNSYFMSKM